MILLNDVVGHRARIGDRIDAAIAGVIRHGRFIMGPEVGELESALAARAGVAAVVSCASGTDALLLPLLAERIGPGDAVVVPSFTFTASAEVVALLGAVPVFADVDRETALMTADSMAMALQVVRREGLRLRAVIPVDLFGQPAPVGDISTLVADDVLVLADAAQSFGASDCGRPVGSLAPVTATSFFPAKPLGCYGDGGAVFTDDEDLAAVLRSVRGHGQGAHKYDTVRTGVNGRLDTLQAAVLIERLAVFDDELVARDQVARWYCERLFDLTPIVKLRDGATSTWAQLVVLLDDAVRDEVSGAMAAVGIPTAVHYPVPLHRQPAFRNHPASTDMSASDWLARSVLSVPMHPYLSESDVDLVVGTLRSVLKTR